MYRLQSQNRRERSFRTHPFDEHSEKRPMHRDDFNALLAWVTAKRFQEGVP
ncbi:MAG: hypothetical protein WCH85_04745 [Methanomicrobiales archaeon]